MRGIKKWLFVTGFSLFSSFLLAQAPALQKADRLYEKMAYPDAIEAYKKVLQQDQGNKHAVLRLADCYRLVHDMRSALRWYKRAVKIKSAPPITYFHLGQVMMMSRKYEQAIPWFEKYKKKAPEDERTDEMIEACRNSKAFKEAASLFVIKRLKINSEASDFGPAFHGDEVIFASARKRSLKTYSRTKQSFLDLYRTAYDGTHVLGEPSMFRAGVNTPYHEANACFSKDGKEMFFTRNNYIEGKVGQSKTGLVNFATYHARFEDGKWQDEVELPFNSSEYSVGHPCLSPDGKRLYFVSNMPGGHGATDLYVVEREGDSWGEPENLGAKINTQGAEMFPWMNPEGVLYFASNGHPGLGGLDLFKIDLKAGDAAEISNVGAPINSSSDDFSMIFDADKGVGFFTSNRPGGKGDDDLYAFVKLLPIVGFVQDEQENPIPDVEVEVRYGRSRIRIGSDEQGKFQHGLQPGRKYLLVFRKVGYEEYAMDYKTHDMSVNETQFVKVQLKKAAAEGE